MRWAGTYQESRTALRYPIFLPFSVTNVGLGDTTPLLSRLIVPRHPLSPHRRKAKRWGAKIFRLKDHLRCPIFLPLSSSCPIRYPTVRSVKRRGGSVDLWFRHFHQTPDNWRAGRWVGQENIQNVQPMCGIPFFCPSCFCPFQ